MEHAVEANGLGGTREVRLYPFGDMFRTERTPSRSSDEQGFAVSVGQPEPPRGLINVSARFEGGAVQDAIEPYAICEPHRAVSIVPPVPIPKR